MRLGDASSFPNETGSSRCERATSTLRNEGPETPLTIEYAVSPNGEGTFDLCGAVDERDRLATFRVPFQTRNENET